MSVSSYQKRVNYQKDINLLKKALNTQMSQEKWLDRNFGYLDITGCKEIKKELLDLVASAFPNNNFVYLCIEHMIDRKIYDRAR